MMSGPEYVYPSDSSIGVHLTNIGYRTEGGLVGWALDTIVRQEKWWGPPLPTSITVASNIITAVFSEAIVCDTTNFTAPVSGLCGFEFHQTGGSAPSISSVSVSGSTATITLSGSTTGTAYLAYAYTGTSGAFAGPVTGPRGNIRSTASITDAGSDTVYSYAPTFNFALPYTWSPPAGSGATYMTGTITGTWK
jgi:hypothetical protein